MTRATRRPEPGFALALTLMVLALISVLLASAYTTANIGQHMSWKFRSQTVAGEAARAGLAHALHELQLDPTWSVGFADLSLEKSRATYSLTFLDTSLDLPPSANNFGGATAVENRDRLVPPGCVHLVSVGRSAGITARAEILARVAAIPPLTQAVATQGKLEVWDSLIDSYDSSYGDYRRTKTRFGANLSTNASARASVNLSDSTVEVDVVVGPRGGTNTVKLDNSALAGTVVVATAPQELLPPRIPAGPSLGDLLFHSGNRTLSPGLYGKLTVSGATLVLTSGSYVFSSIDFKGGSIRVPDGGAPVYVYSRNGVSLSETRVSNASRIPARLWLVAGGGEVRIDGTRSAHMVVCAPASAVRVEETSLFGAVVGSTVRLEETSVHYDRDLARTPGPAAGTVVLARWGE